MRRRAIAAAGKLRAPELIGALVEQFQRRETTLEAASALAGFGPGIEPQLEAILVNEASHVDCRRGIALVLQRLGTREAAGALVATLTSRDPAVRKAAARSLARLSRRHRGVRVEAAGVERAVHAELAAARAALAVLRKLMLPSHGHAPRTAGELLGLLAQIAEIAEEQPLAAGDQVFALGEPGDALYLIVEGKVKVHRGDKELVRLGERDVFGEMAVLDSEPRSASVTALEDAVVLKIGRDDFRDILGERPEIAMGVMKVLTRRLRDTSRKS